MTIMRGLAALSFVCIVLNSATAAEELRQASADLRADRQAGLSGDGGVSRGAAWGDFTGDGYPDLAVANTDGAELFIYKNLDGETFERITEGDVAKFVGKAQGVSWPDVNNDGWLDLFVTAEETANVLYLNDGAGNLIETSAGALTEHVANSTQACWADVDNDGWLDVYVVNADYQDDVMYHNMGGETFEAMDGPWVGLGNHGRSCAWGHANNDMFPDLYVANAYFELGDERRYAPNLFFLNDGVGGFQRTYIGEFVNAVGYSYGVSWFDYDQDGDEDLFVSNISRYAPNMLYENAGGAEFFPAWPSQIMRATPGPAKGHVWADFDNDGDTDLFLAEGHGGARPEHAPFDSVNSYYENTDNLLEAAFIEQLTQDNRVSAGAAAADVDRDGDMDLFISNWFGDDLNNEFYRNDADGNWIQLELRGAPSNRQGVGARVSIITGSDDEARTQFKSLWLNMGYASAGEPVLHFGLGEADEISALTIQWPSGEIGVYPHIDANRRYLAAEGQNLTPVE